MRRRRTGTGDQAQTQGEKRRCQDNSGNGVCQVESYITHSFLNILGVYRPRDGSIPQFLDIFTELLMDIVASITNLVILVDFNIHVNDVDDPNASIFLDTMTALGLKQHVKGSTHKSGNCFDLIFTE